MIQVLLLAALVGLFGQTFEVASIRPQAPNDRGFFVRPPNRGQFTANGAVAKLLVMLAYDVQDLQIDGGPDWFATEKWDIQAKSNNDQHNVDETRLMLQHLLADRFSLRLHRSIAQIPSVCTYRRQGRAKVQAQRGSYNQSRGWLELDLHAGSNDHPAHCSACDSTGQARCRPHGPDGSLRSFRPVG